MSDSAFVFCIIGAAAALMASNRVRFDVVALLVVLALILGDVLSVGSALSGFGSSVVILVAGLLVIGEMLDRTGVARAVGDWILRRGGKNEIQLIVLIMVSAAVLGSAMSSTAVVAIFIPIVLRVAAKTGHASSKLLIPMSYAALISGMLTLIASPPNLVVSDELVSSGHEALGFFSFSLVGLAVLGVAILYIVLIGHRLLPSRGEERPTGPRQRSADELLGQFRIDEHVDALSVTVQSPLAGARIAETGLQAEYGLRALARVRRDRRGLEKISMVSSGMELKPGDVLVVTGKSAEYARVVAEQKLERVAGFQRRSQRWLWEVGLATVMIHPESRLIGQSIVEAEFRTRHGLHVVGLSRGGEAVVDFEHVKLGTGDSLLLTGPWSKIEAMKALNHDFVLLEIPSEYEEIVPVYRKAPIALAILATMVGLSVFDVVPLVVAVILAAMAAVITGCLSAERAYRSIHWSSLVLMAGMLPLADALQQTGGAALIVDGILGTIGDTGPGFMMTVIFALTAALGLVLSNTASAVLVAPIAITAADALQVSPYPFAIAVLIAASAAYSTPVSTPVVTLVVAPGRYRFMDFLKVGAPLLILTWLVTILVTPLIFPY